MSAVAARKGASSCGPSVVAGGAACSFVSKTITGASTAPPGGTASLCAQAAGIPANASARASGKGLRRGDVILSANRTPVTTSEALAKAVADAKKAGRDAVLLEILRRGGPSAFVAIRVK